MIFRKKIKTEFERKHEVPYRERDFLQEFLNEKAKKQRNENIRYFIFIVIPLIFLLGWGLKGCVKIIHDGRIAKAGEYIDKCENYFYASWQGVNGKHCDDARKLYNHYTEKEWREEKESLIILQQVTEHDALYDELRIKIAKDIEKEASKK